MDRHRYGSCALARAAPANEDGPRPFVPLARPVMAFLHSASLNQLSDGGFVFQGRERGEPMSNMAMLELLKNMGRTSRCRDFAAHSKLGARGKQIFPIRRSNFASHMCQATRPRRPIGAVQCSQSASRSWSPGLPSPPSNKPWLSALRLGSRPGGSGLLAVTGEADRTAAYRVCSSILYTLARPMPSALAIFEGPRPSAFI
jgi:hypothetical protein